MNKNFKLFFIFLGFLIPYLLVYRTFFLNGSLAFGDAPFFAPENLKELFNFPFTWNFRNDNFGSPQFYILWLYLPTYLNGILNHYLNLNNDILIRLVFYFPATIFAIFGSWKFIEKFNQNIYGKFLGSFLYGFNTYFLMLVDGGQVGIALAYGLFPLSVLTTINYLEQINVKKYIYALISLFVLFNIDIRIGFISVLLSLLIWLILIKNKEWFKLLRNLCLLGFSILGLCSFWVYPTLLNFSSNLFLSADTSNNFINLSNALFLFQPHFPLNQFGKLSPTPFYFCFILILIFGNLIYLSKFKKNEHKLILKLSLLFLLFIFIVKGGNEPWGELYYWIVNHIPGGLAFRDASKFYIPSILIGGVLFSFTITGLEKIIKDKLIWNVFLLGIYGYLMILIYPAILGNLSGVLGQLNLLNENNYQQIFNKQNQEPGFFRSLYIEEKPAKFYGTFEKPVISANTLYKERPFASMIVGKYDLYNFLHNQQLSQWFNLLGIKYIFLPENERKKILSEKENNERNEFLSFVDNTLPFNKLNWQLSFPGYINNESMPHIFAQKRAVFVIGGEQIYKQLFTLSNFKLQNQGFVFLEEGLINPDDLQGISSQDILLIFDQKNISDLEMSYFQNGMVSTGIALENQWKFRANNEYLAWKYDLLVNDIESYEFDYGKGISFSTVSNERIKIQLDIPKHDKYYLAIRYTNSGSSAGIKINLPNKNYELLNKNPQIFKWEILGPWDLDKGKFPIEIMNKSGFTMVNTLGLISEENYKIGKIKANELLNKNEVIYIKDNKNISKIVPFLKQNYVSIDYKQVNPTKYSISNFPKEAKWLVLSDHYSKNWKIDNYSNYPFYAMINGFYIKNPSTNLVLNYQPQENVKIGVILSLISVILILSTVLYKKRRT